MDKTAAAAGAVSLGNSLSGDVVREGVAHLADSGETIAGNAATLFEHGVPLPQEHLNRVLESGPAMVEQVPVLYYLGAGYLDHLSSVVPVSSHATPLWDLLYYFWDGYSSYVLGAFLMLFGNIDSIVSWGGFILLIVRLIADGPRAWRTIKDWRKHGKE